MPAKWAVFVTAAAAVAFLEATAAPIVQGISFTLDKPDYSYTYSLGVQAYVQAGEAALVDVTATHTSVSSSSTGTWSLDDYNGYWWAWAPQRVPQSEGPLDGSIEVVARDASGESATLTMTFQPEQEMEWPTVAATWNGTGFSVVGAAVDKADFYHLWLWDPIDRYYPSSQDVANPAELADISAANLIDGRTYNLYWIANNYVDTGPNGSRSLYRSYTLQYVTVPTRAVPEPGTAGMVALALGLLVFSTTRLRPVRVAYHDH